jgi:hypothetical protein
MLEQPASNSLLQIFPDLGNNVSLLVLLTGILGLLFILLAFSRFRQRRIVSAGLSALSGAALVCLGALLLAVSLNIHTYQRLTYEQSVAELKFRQLAPRHYQVDLAVSDNSELKQYQLFGDEWQLDARILRWAPPLQLLGLNTRYRLERLSGRYHDDALERSQPRTVYSVSTDAGLDIWSLARDYQVWLPWIDAYYGNATYLPMRDGARFIVTINQYGMIARSGNTEAEDAIYKWR